jgi:hypothetical protein
MGRLYDKYEIATGYALATTFGRIARHALATTILMGPLNIR